MALFDFHLEIEAVSIASDGRIIAWTLLVLMGADPSTATAVNENWSLAIAHRRLRVAAT